LVKILTVTVMALGGAAPAVRRRPAF
jgi:hypothetical protein